jgi:hypothetical protein
MTLCTPPTDIQNASMFQICLNKKIGQSKKNNKNNDIGLFAAECYFAPLKHLNDCIKEPP